MAGNVVAGVVANVKVEPCVAIWGKPQIESFTAIADVAGSLNNDTVLFEVPISNGLDVKKFYIWFNINAAGADPAVANRTAIPVAGATGVTAATLATAIAAALAALPEIASATADGAVVTYQAATVGAVAVPAANGTAAFTTFTVDQEGFGGDFGLLDGDIELTTTEEGVDITAHQEGTNILDVIRTGKNVEIALVVKETTLERLKFLYSRGGGTFTPDAGTEVFGWGNSKDFASMANDAAKLVLHPLSKDEDDLSEDIAFWLAYPQLDSLAISGENPRMIPVTFKVFPDRTKKPVVRLFCFGDHTQDLSFDAVADT